MWNPITIKFDNLFAHKHTEYNFKNNACTVIFGTNKDDRGTENNGAGKTTLFEAICIALTNESLRDIKKETFINREEESCSIDFELYNPVLKMKLRIVRKFYRGSKPVKVEVWENDVLNTQITSVNEANKRVIELLGISREDLLRYFIVSQDSKYSFFTASDVEKKEIMNRITSADMINPVIDALVLLRDEKQSAYEVLSQEISRLTEKKETLIEQKEDYLQNDDTAERIKALEESIAEERENIKSAESLISKWRGECANLETSLKDIKVADVEELQKKRKKLSSELDALEEELSELKRIKRNLETELSESITCPHCSHEFIKDSKTDMTPAEIRDLLAQAEGAIEGTSGKAEDWEAKIRRVKGQIREAEQQKKTYDDTVFSIKQLKNRVKMKEENIEDSKRCVVNKQAEIEKLKNQRKNNAVLTNLNAKIAECSELLKTKEEELKPIESDLNMIKFWQFHMGKSGFKTYLANRSVKIIEGITNSYLRKFGVDISVLINGFTILKSGEVREKIDVFISNDGVTAEKFMGHSGGERGRVTLAGILGIQHLINLSSDGRGLNLLALDEVFPGMDSLGQENIIKIFEKMGITILVITQNVSDSFNTENTLRVVKEGGVSRYINSQQS